MTQEEIRLLAETTAERDELRRINNQLFDAVLTQGIFPGDWRFWAYLLALIMAGNFAYGFGVGAGKCGGP